MSKRNKKHTTGQKTPRRRKQQVTLIDKLRSAVRNDPNNISARLALADFYLRHDHEQLIIDTLGDLETRYPFDDKEQNRHYNILKAYGHAHLKQFIEAEDTTRRLLELDPDSIDGHFVLAYVHLSLRELQPALEQCQQYVSLYQTRQSKGDHDYAVTSAHLSQIYNFMGSIQQDLTHTDEARDYFEQSIKADPHNYLPYLNLAALFERIDDMEKAQDIVRRGLDNCSQVQELRLLAESLKRNATVSACMIVKDEEELLPGCLDSIRDWVDEIIIVDTGSTDRTIEIAKSYGAKLFHQKWEGNFSKHRNYSLEQATGDWLFIIDADERISHEDVPQIRRQINRSDYKVLAVNVFNYSGKYREKVTSLASVRFFRRELNLRYKGIVHNQLDIDPSIPVLRTDIKIEHLGYGLSQERMAEKAERTIKLLEKQLEEEPDNAFALFNYAQVLLGMDFTEYPDNASKIIKAASKAVELTQPDADNRSERDIHLMAMQQLAMTYFLVNDDDKAEELALKLLEYKPDYLDPLLLLGNTYLRKNNVEQAEKYYRRYLQTQATYEHSTGVDEILLMHPRSFHHVNYGLGVVAEHKQEWEKAEQYYKETLRYSPEFLDANARLGHIYLRRRNYTTAEEYFNKQLSINKSSHFAFLGLACINYATGKQEEGDNFVKQIFDEIQPGHPVLLEYARALEEFNQPEQVLRFLDRFSQSEISDTNQLRRLAEGYFRLGQLHKAAELYEKIVATGNPSEELLNDLAGCYFKSGEYAEAEKYYQQALSGENPLPVTYRNLGMTRIKLNKLSEAVPMLEKFLEITPDQPDLHHLLGDIYFQNEDYRTALSHYEAFLKNQTGNIPALFNLSECYLLMGHRDSAILGYQQITRLDNRFQPAIDRLDELLKPVEQL